MTVSVGAFLVTSAVAQLPGAGSSTSSTGTAGAAAKPLSSADRKFIKDAGEQVLAVTHLVELTRHNGPGSEAVKKMNEKIKTDFDKIWGELGTAAQARKVDLPKTEVAGNEKSMLDKLRKTESDKFDKAFLKALDKEMKKTAQVFEAADKSVQEPELKTVVSNWTPKLKGYAEEVGTAENEASKRK